MSNFCMRGFSSVVPSSRAQWIRSHTSIYRGSIDRHPQRQILSPVVTTRQRCLCIRSSQQRHRPRRRDNDAPPFPRVQTSRAYQTSSLSTTTSSISSRFDEPPRPAAADSAKLAALHACLSLPPRLSKRTLARCMVHPTADPDPENNNASLALLGQQLLAYYTAEWLLVHYPRLPMPIIFAAEYAYNGPKTLSALCREWGVEAAASPSPTVDPGLLQFARSEAGNAMAEDMASRVKDYRRRQDLGQQQVGPGMGSMNAIAGSGRPDSKEYYRRGVSSRIVYDDEFGELKSGVETLRNETMSTSLVDETVSAEGNETGDGNGNANAAVSPSSNAASQTDVVSPNTPSPGSSASTLSTTTTTTTTHENASAQFIRAVFGAIYLTSGATQTHSFHSAHILSRHLALHKLFNFKYPTRDLSRLCAREGFEPPVARLVSETGRHSRHPVFVVGVYSGEDKLGEDAGASLYEARTRAAAQALRGWYLYSPPRGDVRIPSRVKEMEGAGVKWKPQMVDIGEIVT